MNFFVVVTHACLLLPGTVLLALPGNLIRCFSRAIIGHMTRGIHVTTASFFCFFLQVVVIFVHAFDCAD
jgi:hypothetical protein